MVGSIINMTGETSFLHTLNIPNNFPLFNYSQICIVNTSRECYFLKLMEPSHEKVSCVLIVISFFRVKTIDHIVKKN